MDEREAADRADVLAWIASGAELYRRVSPADPPQHLVTNFLHHIGCTLWWLIDLDPAGPVHADHGEFSGWAWFPGTRWPPGWVGRTDPELVRM